VAPCLNVDAFAHNAVVSPHGEMGDTLGDHGVTTGAGVFLDRARFANGLHGPRLPTLEFGSPKSAQDFSGVNLFVLVLGTGGTIATGHDSQPKARKRTGAAQDRVAR